MRVYNQAFLQPRFMDLFILSMTICNRIDFFFFLVDERFYLFIYFMNSAIRVYFFFMLNYL